ncbi:MAG: NAD+ synthase [Gammaproteobacteria bacterium]|jgi:NAD+ synthase (glutamine-hydrolysing)|nr:NAD+ synthase [Gammaproteobacteria bacterium]
MHIALAQSNFCVGGIKNNTEQIIKLVNEARKLGAHIIIFPELAICSYPPEDLLLRKALYEQITNAILQISAESNDIDIVIGFPEKTASGTYNACSYIKEGKQQAIYYKQNLPNYGVFDEKRYFSAGSECCLIDLNGIPTALSICEDIWSPNVAQQAKEAGARLLININASPYHTDKQAERESILKQRVEETGLNIVYLNLVGAQDELVFDGASMIIDSGGNFVFRAPQFEEGLYLIDVQQHADKLEFHSALPSASILDRHESIYQALVLGVRDYVRKNGFKGAVIGLSGGIDSALTLTIAVDALGAENVEVLIMPSRYTADMSNDDAQEMADILSVTYHILPIELPFSAFTELLQPVFSDLPTDTTEENIQARSRGVLMMAISNKTGKLVLTTGNKSEMAVGYATLYGDMAGGYAPLKDLSKTLTYELANWRNSQEQVIPQRIIDRPPSAELRPDQKDEDSLPSYDVLDPILARYIELDQSPDEIVNAGFERETVLEIVRMVDRNEYKRRQAAPGVRITRRAFGRDRRYPITSGYQEF